MKIKNKKWFAIIVLLYIVSSLVISQTIYCLLSPASYPIGDIENRQDYKKMPNPPVLPQKISDTAYFSTINFLPVPITTKQLIIVNLNGINEVNVDWYFEVRLLSSLANATWVEINAIPETELRNLRVVVDGTNVNYQLNENQLYNIPIGLNFTREYEVKRIELHFTFARQANSYHMVKTPLIYNTNYGKFINFPVATSVVELDKTTDSNIFEIDLHLPFQRILMEQSGWVDGFTNPPSEWVTQPNGETQAVFFEYPIIQNRSNNGDHYSFTSYFSASNDANLIQIVVVPNYTFTLFLILLLASPFFIPILELINNKIEENYNKKKNRKKSHFWRATRSTFEFYGVLFAIFAFASGGNVNFDFFAYLTEITLGNTVGLALIVSYPLLFCFTFYKVRG